MFKKYRHKLIWKYFFMIVIFLFFFVEKDLESFILLIYRIMATPKSPKKPQKYFCQICDYTTSNSKDFNRHLATQKHNRNTSATFSNNLATQKSYYHICYNCNKEYRDRTGLWRHKKTCLIPLNDNTQKDNNIDNNKVNDTYDISTKELILMIFKQNTELQQALIETSKQNSMTNNNNNNTTNNTKETAIDTVKNKNT
jgi:hypothetical protein